MQRYRNDEDLDEYEDDLEDQYEDQSENEEDVEEDEEEDEEKMKEAITYLESRERLKAKHRSILRRENGKNGVNINPSKLNGFGSFFGPSKPVIADRVIQERKSLLETRHLAPKASTYQNDVKKASVSSATASKNGPSNRPPPRQVKSKVQLMKDTRDYAFLLSDEAEIPKPAKDPGQMKSLVAKPGLEDARSAQVRAKRHEPSSHSGRKDYDGLEQRKPSSGSSQGNGARNPPPQKLTSGNRASLPCDSRRQLDLRKQSQPSKQAGRGNESESRPAVRKVLPPKKPLSSNDRKLPAGSMERKSSATPVGIKASAVAKTSTLDRQRLPMVKHQASGVNSRLEHKRDVHRSAERNVLKKENVGASRLQMAKPTKQGSLQSNMQTVNHIKKQRPSGQLHNSSTARNNDYNIKKRKAPDPESDSEFDYRSAIRNMFGYRPTQYHDDDDVSDMEVGFDAVLEEEKRSARIAKQEDDEELVKILEEERREAMRKKAKMRKMNQR